MKVSKVIGTPKFERTVADMNLNEVAYIVPWAFNPETGELDENRLIVSVRGGSSELKVYRNILGEFEVDFTDVSFKFPN